MDPSATRRDFLSSSAALLGGGLLSLNEPIVSLIAGSARVAAQQREPFRVLTPAEARTMEAFAEQIIPADPASPGARDAGAVYFADHALGSFFAAWLPPVRAGLADLDARARSRRRGVAGFADLSAADQQRIIRQVERTPFFDPARMLSVMGTIADPAHGGNRDGARERILNIEHRPAFQPPFGHYDAEYVRQRRGGGE